MRSLAEPPRVIICLETARGFGRDLLRGIAGYAHAHGPWNFYVTTGEDGRLLPRERTWKFAGIVARVANAGVAEDVRSADVPTIGVACNETTWRLEMSLTQHAGLNPDAIEVGLLAAEHFLARDLRHFAYVGNGMIWSNRRGESFGQHLHASGFNLLDFPVPCYADHREWEDERIDLAQWLTDLPRPTGLLACNDERGQQVLEACRLSGLRVPEDVAVLGVDNDDVFCALANPPLSSIELNTEAVGYRAAELLDAMMQRRVHLPPQLDVAGVRVVTRRSTEVTVAPDSDVKAALEYIHRSPRLDISVSDVARHAAVSRRLLERRFRKSLGRSVMDEIQMARMTRAKRLLLDTGDSIARIADATGFGSTEYFITVFHRHIGKTPGAFRESMACTSSLAVAAT